jgi:hypothetical protein
MALKAIRMKRATTMSWTACLLNHQTALSKGFETDTEFQAMLKAIE